jgi:hypothetical protein
MQTFVSTLAGSTLLVSMLIAGMPSSGRAAGTGNAPVASWPHTIVSDEATIVVYPSDKNFEAVKEHVPGTVIQEKDLPAIYVSTQPAVIILTKGAPTFSPVRGTKLLYVSNTDSDLFKDSRDGQYYYLTSGRWFRASSLNGPWTFATPDLPQDFASTPGRTATSIGTPTAAGRNGITARGTRSNLTPSHRIFRPSPGGEVSRAAWSPARRAR